MGNLSHYATRIFGTPLMIEPKKMEVILSAIGPRIGIHAEPIQNELFGPGDTGRQRKAYYVTEDKIAVIDVVGPLVKRSSGDFMSGGPTTYGEVETEFLDAVTDPEIRGVLLQIDSPGGESVGCFELADLIRSQRGAKPVYAVADGDAFSAAYAIASAASRVYVAKSGGVGSVGVWAMHVDQSAFNAKLGVKPTYIFAGARKIDGNPHAPLSDEARESFQAEIDRLYDLFTDAVAAGRKMSPAAVRATEAALFHGENAVTVGFADKVGTLSDAMADLRRAIDDEDDKARAATTARGSKTKGGSRMSEPDEKVIAEEPVAEEEEAVEEAVQTEAPPADEEKPVAAAIINRAADIAEFCALAGLAGRAAEFIRSGASVDDVRAQLLAARAATDAEEQIQSRLTVEEGATSDAISGKTATSESPIVKAAERLAASMGKEKK